MNMRGLLKKTKKQSILFYKKYGSLTRVFGLLFLLVGLAFVFIVPPFQNPDEPMHFYRSYQIASGQVSSVPNDDQVYGGDIPVSFRKFVADSGIEHNYDYGYRFHLDYLSLLKYKYDGAKVFEGFPNTAIYSPLAYVPSTVAHVVVKTFNGPLLVALYLGRILSLLFVFIAFVLAIKLIPVGKWILVVVGLLPMTIASAASVSSDAMTIGVSVLFIAVVMNVAFLKQRPKVFLLIIFVALTLLLAFIKQAHIALLLFIVLIPFLNPYFRRKKPLIALICLSVLTVICFLVWYKHISPIVINFDPLVQPGLQKSFVLHHPVHFVTILLHTYFDNYANGIFIGLFGNFGWLTATMPVPFMIFSAFIIYFAVTLKDKAELRTLATLTKKQLLAFRLTLWGVFFAVVLLISTALYLYWTPYTQAFIIGIQGRYLLALLPLLLIPFVGMGKGKQGIKKSTLVICITIVLIAAVYILKERFIGGYPS
ncbi:MAG: hypothetical protein JWO99_848 [Candidatus Saccharibacteria bacterium]|nr:hypothetical protein [Candidatus Saccharibacteria bacterium]